MNIYFGSLELSFTPSPFFSIFLLFLSLFTLSSFNISLSIPSLFHCWSCYRCIYVSPSCILYNYKKKDYKYYIFNFSTAIPPFFFHSLSRVFVPSFNEMRVPNDFHINPQRKRQEMGKDKCIIAQYVSFQSSIFLCLSITHLLYF